MTRALITGVTGMVGSHLLDYLLEHTDWEIYGMLRWRSPLNNLFQHVDRINSSDRVRLVYADLRDTMSIQAAVRECQPDYVFHLAAQSYPKTSFDSPLDTLDTNMLNRLSFMSAHHRRFSGVSRLKSYQLMKNVLFIQHRHMLSRRLVRIW